MLRSKNVDWKRKKKIEGLTSTEALVRSVSADWSYLMFFFLKLDKNADLTNTKRRRMAFLMCIIRRTKRCTYNANSKRIMTQSSNLTRSWRGAKNFLPRELKIFRAWYFYCWGAQYPWNSAIYITIKFWSSPLLSNLIWVIDEKFEGSNFNYEFIIKKSEIWIFLEFTKLLNYSVIIT